MQQDGLPKDYGYELTAEKILDMEDNLGKFTLVREPSYQDTLLYRYVSDKGEGDACLTRGEALFSYVFKVLVD